MRRLIAVTIALIALTGCSGQEVRTTAENISSEDVNVTWSVAVDLYTLDEGR